MNRKLFMRSSRKSIHYHTALKFSTLVPPASGFSPTMPRLAEPSVEINTLIAIELETDDFPKFRLACKELNSKSFSQFLSGYFKTRYHMLDRDRLNNVLEVSGHSVFRPSVQVLEIGVDHLTNDSPLYPPGAWDHLSP
jgi:hypothetical protein